MSVPDTARALADAARPATDAAFQALPDDAKSGHPFGGRGGGQRVHIVTGNAEYDSRSRFSYFCGPRAAGVFGGAFDAYFANAFDAVLLGKKFDKGFTQDREAEDGSFGSVSYARHEHGQGARGQAGRACRAPRSSRTRRST